MTSKLLEEEMTNEYDFHHTQLSHTPLESRDDVPIHLERDFPKVCLPACSEI